MTFEAHELKAIKKHLNIPTDITNETIIDALKSIYNHLGLTNIQYNEIIKDIEKGYLILEHADNGDYLWYEKGTSTSYEFIKYIESVNEKNKND
jgi:hypothetical protein